MVERQCGESSAQRQLRRHGALERATRPVPEQKTRQRGECADRRGDCVLIRSRVVGDDAKEIDGRDAAVAARQHSIGTGVAARAVGEETAHAIVQIQEGPVLGRRYRLRRGQDVDEQEKKT